MNKHWDFEVFKAMVAEHFNIEVWDISVPALYQLGISTDDFIVFLLESKVNMVEKYEHQPIEEYKLRLEIDDDSDLLHIYNNCFETAWRV